MTGVNDNKNHGDEPDGREAGDQAQDHDTPDETTDQGQWSDWVEDWRSTMPAKTPEVSDPDDDEAAEPAKKHNVGRIVVVTLVAAAVVGVSASLAAIKLFTPPESEQTTTAQGANASTAETEGQPVPESSGTTCQEGRTDGKLVTSSGGPIDNPEDIIAEFQHRYFDLRDGEQVAKLWEGYDGPGFQASIDSALEDAPANVNWCLTVMPADSSGWWNTEVAWWGSGDESPREVWEGTYKVEERGNSYVMTETKGTAS